MNRRRYILFGCLVTLLAAVGVWRAESWWTEEPPWEELEEAAATFPTPPGYKQIESVRSGDRPAICDIKPCKDPGVAIKFRQVGKGPDVCRALEYSATEWETRGFRRISVEHASSLCVVDGKIDDHRVQLLELGMRPDEFKLNIWG